jgi:ribose-phosphate pyrophosphokinase
MNVVLDSLPIPVRFIQFSGGERHVQIEAIPPVKAKSATIRADIRSSNDLLDYLLLEDALLQISPTLSLHLEVPYLPYARQDRVCAPGQAFSLQVLTNLLRLNPKASITVWDCHSPVGLDLLGAKNIGQEDIISQCPALVAELQSPDTVLVAPDKGAVGRTLAVAGRFGLHDIIFCEKKRDPTTGKITEFSVSANSLAGKTAVITDDICDGGMTFIGVAEALRARSCTRILLYVTHGIFSKSFESFTGKIDHVFCSDSFPQTTRPNLTTIAFKSARTAL